MKLSKILKLSRGTVIHEDYFDDPMLSDLTIRLSDRTFHVHKIILCRRSKYFETLITGVYKVSVSLVSLDCTVKAW
jgi:hypothetical protein